MKDILGRTIKDGDLVVVKPSGRYSRGLDIGIWLGGSVRCKRVRASYTQVFLIENPTEKELEIKNEILENIRKSKEASQKEKERRRALKRIPKKDLIIGQAYLDEKGATYIYLGTGKYREDYYRSGSWDDYEEGNLYISVGSWDEKHFGNNFDTLKNVTSKKTPKKLVAIREGFKLDIDGKRLFAEKEVGTIGLWSSSTRKYAVEIILD